MPGEAGSTRGAGLALESEVAGGALLSGPPRHAGDAGEAVAASVPRLGVLAGNAGETLWTRVSRESRTTELADVARLAHTALVTALSLWEAMGMVIELNPGQLGPTSAERCHTLAPRYPV